MENNNRFIINGAICLAVGAFVSKLLGALYRIPLTNILGGEGIGLYQMVFPVYTLLLDFSGAGVPNALSKIISSKNQEDREEYALKILKRSIRFFALFGLIGTLFMSIFSFPLSTAQGNKNAYLSYITLSPSVILVSVISCFRGYFQGLKKMLPTAISQIAEQIVKLVFGLTFAYVFRKELFISVSGATLGVTISEAVAVIILYLLFENYVKRKDLNIKNVSYERGDLKKVLLTVLPVTMVGIAMPLIHIADSFLIINILGKYTVEATLLYGLFSGAAHTLISLPVSLCYGISAVAIPAISGEKNTSKADKNANKTLLLTLFISLFLGACVFFFSPLAVKILFSRFSVAEKVLTVKLVKILSVNVIFVSLLQTENAVLIAKGRAYTPLFGLTIGFVVNVLLEIILLSNPKFGIYGGAISSIACYFCACLVNFIMIKVLKVKNASKRHTNREYSNG